MKLVLNYNPEYKHEVPRILEKLNQWKSYDGQVIFKVEPKENSNQIILNFFDLKKERDEAKLLKRLQHLNTTIHSYRDTSPIYFQGRFIYDLWNRIQGEIYDHCTDLSRLISEKEYKKNEPVRKRNQANYYTHWLKTWKEELLNVAERFNRVSQCDFYVLFPERGNNQRIQIIADEIKMWDGNLLAEKCPVPSYELYEYGNNPYLDTLYIMVVKNNWVLSNRSQEEFKNIVSSYKTKAMLISEEEKRVSKHAFGPLFYDQVDKIADFSIFEIKKPEVLEEFSFKLLIDLGYRGKLSADYILAPCLIHILPAVLLNLIAEYCDFSFEEIKQGELELKKQLLKQTLLTQFITQFQWQFNEYPEERPGRQYIEFHPKHYAQACALLGSHAGLFGYRISAMDNNIEVYPDFANDIKTVQASLGSVTK